MAQLVLKESGIDEIVNTIHLSEGINFLPLLELIVSIVIEEELKNYISASRYEQTPYRKNFRNGKRYRKRGIQTGLGAIYPEIPKLRAGSFYPKILDQYSRIDSTLYNVIAEAYVNGVSTRKMKRLFADCGLKHIDKNLVSRCGEAIEDEVAKWRNRPLNANYAYIWVDAIYTKVRDEGRVRSSAVLIATGVREDGCREILGCHLGNSESSQNWKDFFQSMKSRGLQKCELWISDDHDGIKKALDECFPGQQRQRCIVHWVRNAASKLSKSERNKYLPLFKNIINSNTKAAFNLEWDTLIKELEKAGKYKLIDWLESSYEEIIIYLDFPPEHWSRIKSTNPIERINREIRQRERSVIIFPNERSCLKLIGSQLKHISNSWLEGNKYLTNPMERIEEYMMKNKEGIKKELKPSSAKA